MPVELATDLMAVDISEISSSVLSVTPHCVQELDMTPLFASNLLIMLVEPLIQEPGRPYMVSKSDTQSDIDGHPELASPFPPKTAYDVALSRLSKKRVDLTVSTVPERMDGTGSPEMSVGRPPATRSYAYQSLV